jgi:hypothetical protein
MRTLSLKTTLARCTVRVCAILSAALLVMEPVAPLHAQVSAAAEPPRSMQIVILDGEGALNNIQARTAREPIVQVQDHNRKPIAGAAVLFSVHGGADGAGGAFADGASTFTVTTGPDGIAHAPGLAPNASKGAWQIEVTASLGALTAATVINEINFIPLPPPAVSSNTAAPVAPAPHGFFSKPIMITSGLIIAGAIIGIVVAETQGNGPTKITPGTGTVGPPSVTGSAPLGGGIRIRF